MCQPKLKCFPGVLFVSGWAAIYSVMCSNGFRVMSIMICARRHASAGKKSQRGGRCLPAIAQRRNFCVAHRTSNLSFRWCFRFTFVLTRACIKKYTIIITCYCNNDIYKTHSSSEAYFYLWQKMDPTRHQETFFSCMQMLQSFCSRFNVPLPQCYNHRGWFYDLCLCWFIEIKSETYAMLVIQII